MRGWICAVLAAPLGVAFVNGCTGDDEFFNPRDAGTFETGGNGDGGGHGGDGGGPRLGCGDAGNAPPRMLVTGGLPTTGELVAFDIDARRIDGRLSFPGAFGGMPFLSGSDPYLLTQADEIIRLDPREPWKSVAKWNVKGDDVRDGGNPIANPSAIVVPGCDKGYVLRFNRNKIAVIDTGNPAGGVPTGYIDLSSLVQTDDRDGNVDMTSAVYVPSRKRVYVLLGNIDLGRVVDPTGNPKLVCSQTVSSIVAIDTTTDALVNLGGTAPGGGIALLGTNPPIGPSFYYDAARDKLVVLHAGCNAALGDGGAGAMSRRQIDEVNLQTGQVTEILDLNGRTFPSSLAYADGTRAALAFFFNGFVWNPSQPSLGAEIAGGIDVVSHDGRGNLVGSHGVFFLDGGSALELVRSSFATPDASAVMATDPFTNKGAFVVGVEVWPRN
jgi:hypothetical protein